MSKELDDHNLDQRLLDQASEILEHLELIDVGHNAKLPFKERIAAMIMCNTIRKDTRKGKDDSDNAGSAVRKYSKSFADAASRRTAPAGSDADDDAPRGANGPAGPYESAS